MPPRLAASSLGNRGPQGCELGADAGDLRGQARDCAGLCRSFDRTGRFREVGQLEVGSSSPDVVSGPARVGCVPGGDGALEPGQVGRGPLHERGQQAAGLFEVEPEVLRKPGDIHMTATRIAPRGRQGKPPAAGYNHVVILLLLAVLSLSPVRLEARGRAESGAGAALEAKVLLLYSLGNEPEALVRERMDLPASAAALFWSSYRVEAGQVHIERSGSYSLPRLISREESGRWAIYSYRLTMAPPESGGRQVDVSFTDEEAGASGLQPGPYAVREGIRADGAAAGTARLARISRSSAGRFRAVVELR